VKRFKWMLVVVSAGGALAYFLTTPRGRGFLSRGTDLLRQCCAWGSCSCASGTPEDTESDGGACGSANLDMQAKIDETRRRLREKLNETLGATPPVGTDPPHAGTTA
jgi:hypothetical protein